MFYWFFVPRIFNLYAGYPEKCEFIVRRTISVTTTTFTHYSIDFPIPKNTPYQTVNAVRVNSSTAYVVETKYGYDWLNWSGDLTPTSKELKIVVTYHINTSTMIWNINSTSAGLLIDIPSVLTEKYNHNEWYLRDKWGRPIDRDKDGRQDVMIEPSAVEIREVAFDLIENKNVYDIVKSFYDYIIKNIKYTSTQNGKYMDLPKHALATLRERVGDCDEQSFLFVSMCRAIGIPAWCEYGAFYNVKKREWSGHGWSVVYIPLSIGGGVISTVDTASRQFLLRDPYRFTIYEDDGNGAHLEDFYNIIVYSPSGSLLKFEERYEHVEFSSFGRIELYIIYKMNISPRRLFRSSDI
jgi:hypothetical protein